MIKLIIQIPCYNEEKTLPLTYHDLPKRIKGIKKIETQIIDDGSSDKTIKIAKKLKIDHIVRLKKHHGLAAAFKAGIDNAVLNNADILVNTDADNQYQAKDIEKLIQPILLKTADVVVGQRPIKNHPEFSSFKKWLQRYGSILVKYISGINVPDATSGFRAYNRDSLLKLNLFSKFSYTIETLIQAGNLNLTVVSIPIRINKKTRPSRLFKSIPDYLFQSTKTIIGIFQLYKSKLFFNLLSLFFLVLGTSLVIRFLIRITFFWFIFKNFLAQYNFSRSIIND